MIKKCFGCGVPLQIEDKNKEGYTSNIENNLCERCFRLTNYSEYKEVSLTNDDYEKILNNIPSSALVVYLTSLLNLNLDYIDRFPNVIIVLTKKDLLPKSVKDYKLINYVQKKVKNYLAIEVVSSIKNYHLDNLINQITKSNYREVYFVGMTNSGKSTLINKLIQDYNKQDSHLTTSIYPSTTLDKVEIDLNNLKIIDTPGLVSSGSILNYLPPESIKKITPKKEIKPRSYQLKDKCSLIIADYLRIDFHAATNVTIYLANNLPIIKTGPNHPKLKDKNHNTFHLSSNKDVVAEDLCFIKFTAACSIDIYSLYDINIYERDNLI